MISRGGVYLPGGLDHQSFCFFGEIFMSLNSFIHSFINSFLHSFRILKENDKKNAGTRAKSWSQGALRWPNSIYKASGHIANNFGISKWQAKAAQWKEKKIWLIFFRLMTLLKFLAYGHQKSHVFLICSFPFYSWLFKCRSLWNSALHCNL